jgi:glycosyltransferase involved in cell wall biosynthesis
MTAPSQVGEGQQELDRLRVLFLPSWYPSELHALSGTFIREHARAVAPYHDVVVLFAHPLPSSRQRYWRPVCQETDDDGVRTVLVKYPSMPSARGNWLMFVCASLWGILRLRKTFRPDLIHAHVILPAGFAATIAGIALRIPFIVTEHRGPFSAQMRTWRQRALARFAVSRSQAIIPVSNSLRRDMEGFALKGRYFVTPETVDFTIFRPAPQTVTQESSILAVSALIPDKGLSYLLKAVALLHRERKDPSLHIVGDGPEERALKEMARELQIDGVVRFHGLKTKEEVASLMQRCSFFVLPSLAETFGCVVAEALACGKPVVVTRCGGPEDFVNENVGLLVPPGEAGALARAIEHMLDHYRLYDPNQISNYARERFSHQAVGSAINEVYKRVLSCPC